MSIGSLIAVPLPNGFFGVFWILETAGVRQPYFYGVVLDGFSPKIPAQVELRFMPRPFRDHYDGHYENVYKASFVGKLPKDFVEIGVREPTAAARALDHSGTYCLQNGEALRGQMYDQWRWLNDRERLQSEWHQRSSEHQAREAERKKQQTLPKMLRERPFKHGPSKQLAREAHRLFKAATEALIDLQKKGTKKKRVAVLKKITTELNAIDDGSIETVEREEIVQRVDELAALVGITNDDEQLTGHRDW